LAQARGPVPCRSRRHHLAGRVEADPRRFSRRARGTMTSAGQQAKNPRPVEDTGIPLRPAADLAVRQRARLSTATAVTYWPVATSAAVMAGLPVWRLPRGAALGNDEGAPRYAAPPGLPHPRRPPCPCHAGP